MIMSGNMVLTFKLLTEDVDIRLGIAVVMQQAILDCYGIKER